MIAILVLLVGLVLIGLGAMRTGSDQANKSASASSNARESPAYTNPSLTPGNGTPVPPPVPTGSPPLATNAPMQTTGYPAIKPTITNAGPDSPAFTKDDVISYRKAQPNSIWDYASSVPITIEKIEFLTEGQLKARVSSYASGLPEDTLLCFVQYKGAFLQDAPPGFAPIPRAYGFEVFDAHTGNHLASGVSASLK